jgi:hypothetical protein
MRLTEHIDDPNWDDIIDRDVEILKLKVRLRRAEVRQTTISLAAIEMRKNMLPCENWTDMLKVAIEEYDAYFDKVRREREST